MYTSTSCCVDMGDDWERHENLAALAQAIIDAARSCSSALVSACRLACPLGRH